MNELCSTDERAVQYCGYEATVARTSPVVQDDTQAECPTPVPRLSNALCHPFERTDIGENRHPKLCCSQISRREAAMELLELTPRL